FRAGSPDSAAFFGDVVDDAAVAGVGDVVFELEFEVAEFVFGDEVAGVVGIFANEQAVADLPAGFDFVGFEVVPAGEVCAVEEGFPAGGFFVIGDFGEKGDLGDAVFVEFVPFVAEFLDGFAGVIFPEVFVVFAGAGGGVDFLDEVGVVFADDPIDEVAGDAVVGVVFGAAEIA